MDKYTHRFKDEHLENLYWQKQFTEILYPSYIFMTSLFVLITLTQLIQGQLNQFYEYQTYQIVILIFLAFQLIVTRCYPRGIGVAFYLVNHCLQTFYLTLAPNLNSQNAYLTGQNIMILQAIIMFVNVYKIAFVGNLTLCITRIIIITQSAGIQYDQLVITIIITLFVMVCRWKTEQQMRSLFLFHAQSQQWSKLLPAIVKDQYAIFAFDREQIKFTSQYSNFIGIDMTLQEFLRKSTYNKITLELFLHNQIKNTVFQNEIIDKQITFQFNKQDIQLTYSILNLTELTITVVIHKDPKAELKALNSKLNDQLISKLSNYLQSGLQVFHKIIKMRQLNAIFKLQSVYLNNLAFLIISNKKLTLSKVNLTKIISYCVKCNFLADKQRIQIQKPRNAVYVYSNIPLLMYIIDKLLSTTEAVSRQEYCEFRIIGKHNSLDELRVETFQNALDLTHISCFYEPHCNFYDIIDSAQLICQVPTQRLNSFLEMM